MFLFLFDADRICTPGRNRRNGSYICLFLDLVLVPSRSPFRSPHCSCSRLPVPCCRVCSHVQFSSCSNRVHVHVCSNVPFSSCSNRVHVHVCLMFRSVLVQCSYYVHVHMSVQCSVQFLFLFSSCSCSGLSIFVILLVLEFLFRFDHVPFLFRFISEFMFLILFDFLLVP